MRTWKVGELAKQTGLTVRTLHHYDQIGLLSPSHRTAAGHRLYVEDDVARLQQVASLRNLGFPLEEIRDVLNDRRMSPLQVVQLHADRVRQQVRSQQRLVERLDALAKGLQMAETVSADQLIQTIEEITMFEKYYTPEQMDYLAQRREQVGEGRIAEVEAEWPRLMDQVRAEMEAGTDPCDPRVQELARRWKGLVEEFTGGNEGIRQSLGNLYQNESTVHGMDVAGMRPLMEYVGRAWGCPQA
ncbi:MerR family transcriptional regulator [Longimicrobium sp.]|uniref:MerR family transcriptional regulator n=1 Tax=Longimicrobium sp. TaxID=2029185 RepID=UPI003B3A5DEF